MKRISHYTFFRKRVFPAIWIGFWSSFVFLGFAVARDPNLGLLILTAFALTLAVAGHFVARAITADLADEVWDCGEELLVKHRGREGRVLLTDCTKVEFTGSRPPRITLILRQPSVFGTQISFCPHPGRIPFSTPPLVAELNSRIHAARSEKHG